MLASVAPAAALAHDSGSHAVQAHIEQDFVENTAAEERRYERRTEALAAADAEAAAAAVTGNDHVRGRPMGPGRRLAGGRRPRGAAPNGKVLAYDSVGDNATETYADHDFTRATVWDPATGAQTPVNVLTGFNIFCSGLAHLTDGSVFVGRRQQEAQLHGHRADPHLRPGTNTWTPGAEMAVERWYPSVTPLTNGEMLITGGGPDMPEVRTTDGSMRRAEQRRRWTCRSIPGWTSRPTAAPSTRVPTRRCAASIPPAAAHGRASAQRDAEDRDYGSHAMYDMGKILVAGGGASSDAAQSST